MSKTKKRNIRSTQPPSPEDKHVMIRLILLMSILLGVVLCLSHILLAGLAENAGKWLNGIRTGLGLIIFWLFVTTAVRSLHKHRPEVAFIYSVLTGVATAVLGTLIFLIGLRMVALLWSSEATLPSYSIIGFYTAAGLVASLFSLIHLRVENRRLGSILEFVLVIGSAILFLWLVG